ncbi:sensor domain-containing protein [Mycolicibacterium sp. XJ775]
MSDETRSLTQSAERWLSLAALIVAPTSLITGLCYFYGLLFIHDRLHYFGVDPSTLGYTSADYAVTTIRVFFFAAFRVLIVMAVLVALTVGVRRWAASERRIPLLRTIAWLSAAAGAAGLIVAVVWLTSEYSMINWVIKGAPPIYMAGLIVAGIALLVAGYSVLALTGGVGSLGRLPKIAERTMLVLAVITTVAALFWVTKIYASDQGKRDGAFAAGVLWAADGEYTAVQLDTTEVLGIPGSLVKKSTLPAEGPPAAPVYRYQCLRVLEAHGGRYVLVPARWSRENGYVITVTPDASHRITGVVNSTQVAKGGTVDPYWQCPEVVRVFQPSDLEPILLSAETTQTLSGAGRLSVTGPDTITPDRDNTATPDECVPEDFLAKTPIVRERAFTGDGPWVRERAMMFDNPAQAEEFMAGALDRWNACAGMTAALNRYGEAQPRTLGTLGVQERILSMPDSASSTANPDCTQALAAKSNIVVAVDVCGTGDPARAVAIAYDIRERIPTN